MSEHRVQDVGAASHEGNDRLVVVLALRPVSLVERFRPLLMDARDDRRVAARRYVSAESIEKAMQLVLTVQDRLANEVVPYFLTFEW